MRKLHKSVPPPCWGEKAAFLRLIYAMVGMALRWLSTAPPRCLISSLGVSTVSVEPHADPDRADEYLSTPYGHDSGGQVSDGLPSPQGFASGMASCFQVLTMHRFRNGGAGH